MWRLSTGLLVEIDRSIRKFIIMIVRLKRIGRILLLVGSVKLKLIRLINLKRN